MQKVIPFFCCICFCCLQVFGEQAFVQKDAPVFQVGDNQAVRKWLLSDPVPLQPHPADKAAYAVDFLRSIGGEQQIRPDSATTFLWQQQAFHFANYESKEDIINLARVYNKDQHLVYAFCYLESDRDQDVYLHMGSDDGYTVYLNHEEIWNHHSPRGVRKNSDVVAVHLQKGRNPLLIKNHNGTGGWGFVVEVLDLPHHLAAIFDTKLEIGYTRTGRLGRRLSLSPHSGNIYLGKHADLLMPVTWRVFDLAGRLVTEKNGDFFSETHLRLPFREGLYEIEMELPTLDHSRKKRSTGLIMAENMAQFVSDQIRLAEEFIEQETEKHYSGWVAYAKFRAKTAIEKSGIEDGVTASELIRLHRAKTDAVARVLPQKTGRFEWAYYSRVDGSGQPFRIAVPAGYDPLRAYPLVINLHGAGGRHQAESAPEQEEYAGDMFQVDILGRARYGMYQYLSEVDILECLAYVRRHWQIDPQQIHLEGGSMGGGGVFKLASRFPHLFASGILSAGFGTDIDVENLLHVPLYSLHSKDDPTVSITSSRTPLDALAGLGGEVVKYETDGLQHAIWQDRAAFATAHHWRRGRRRPEQVDHIRFTAVDELSSAAYWARILQWGERAANARFEIRVQAANRISMEMDNIGLLVLNLREAPLDQRQDAQVFVGDRLVGRIPAPLPPLVYVSVANNSVQVLTRKPDEPAYRRHFPGGVGNLFHGEPLLIVWGTQGDNRMDAVLQNAALMAGRSPNPAWLQEEEGEPLYRMLFAQLRVKADVDVSPEDLQRYNLLLLGTAATNSVISALADRLPAQLRDGSVVLSDGLSYEFTGRAMGLLYYNPLAPQRYIYLASSDDPEFYRAGTPLMNIPAKRPAFFDFVLMSSRDQTLVSGRHFQSDWRWEAGYASSGVLPASLCRADEVNELKARALMESLGSDFVVLENTQAEQLIFSKNESRWADLTGYQETESAVTLELSGRELLKEWDKLQGAENQLYTFYPETDSKTIVPDRLYEICFPTGRTLWYYHRMSKRDFTGIERTGLTAGEAIRGFGTELSNER